MKMYRVVGVDCLGQHYCWTGIHWSDDLKEAALMSEQTALAVIKAAPRDLTETGMETKLVEVK